MYLHFDRFSPGVFHPFGFSVCKGLERFDPIEDSLYSILWRLRVQMACFQIHLMPGSPQDATFLLDPTGLKSLLPGEAESGSAGTQPDKE